MNAKKLSVTPAGLVVVSVLAITLAGCRTRVVEHTRTVYLPAPTPVENTTPPAPPPQVVYEQSAPPPPPQVVIAPPPAPREVVVIQSENDFYEPLSAYGRWVMAGAYGRVWVPSRVERGWRPYSNGYWQRTDAGWYWASDEPWGWATYHYGRWDYHATYGWVWVPQTQWAPAWVDWREGGGYVGWAPLRPRMEHAREPAFDSRAFVFVEHKRMLEPVRPKNVIVNNTVIINKTVNITQVKVVNKTVINEGPRPEVIERESGRKVKAVPAREVRHREEAPVATRQHQAEKVAAPAAAIPQVEKPNAVAPQLPPPVAMPVRPTPRPELETPAHVEKENGIRNGRKTALADTNEPAMKAVTSPELNKAVLPRKEVHPPVARPTATSVPTNPERNEKKREPTVEKNNVTPGAIQAGSKHETNAPAKARAAQPAVIKKQPAPQPAKPAMTRPASPKAKLPAIEQAEANKKQKDAGNFKKGDTRNTLTNTVPEVPAQ